MYKNGFGINNLQWLMCYKSKSGKLHWKSTRQAQHLTFQCGLSPLQPQQMHLKLPNCASPYQNIAKLLSHPNKSNAFIHISVILISLELSICTAKASTYIFRA